MKLGIISWIREEDFIKVKDKGLSFVELDVNDRAEEFLAHVDEVKEYSERSRLWDAGEADGSVRTASAGRNLLWNAV